MLTTTTHGAPVLAAAAALVVGAAVVVLAALADGAPGAYGALVGTAFALVVFSFGVFAVGAVARLMPAASLLVAMLTYTTQVLLMLVFFVALTRAGVVGDTLDREWLGASIIVAVLAWTLAQVIAFARSRIPLYDTSSDGSAERPVGRSSEGVRPAVEGGAR